MKCYVQLKTTIYCIKTLLSNNSIEYCKLIGEKTYSEAKNKSENVLKGYLSLIEQNASFEEQSIFLEKNGINYKKIHVDTISDFSINLYRTII